MFKKLERSPTQPENKPNILSNQGNANLNQNNILFQIQE